MKKTIIALLMVLVVAVAFSACNNNKPSGDSASTPASTVQSTPASTVESAPSSTTQSAPGSVVESAQSAPEQSGAPAGSEGEENSKSKGDISGDQSAQSGEAPASGETSKQGPDQSDAPAASDSGAPASSDGSQSSVIPDEFQLTDEDELSFSEAVIMFATYIESAAEADNLIAVLSNQEGVFMRENVQGEKDVIVYIESNGEESLIDYTYVNGDGEYVFAEKDGNKKYYLLDKDKYDDAYRSYSKPYFMVFADVTEETPYYGKVFEGTDGKTTVVMTLELADYVSSVMMEIADDKVVKFVNVFATEDGEFPITITFEYGNAEVDIPDMTDWFNGSAPKVASEWYVVGTVGGEAREEIALYYDYETGEYVSDYFEIQQGDAFKIKNKNDDAISYPLHGDKNGNYVIDEDFLCGHEMIAFDAEAETISLISDGDPEISDDPVEVETWTVVGNFGGEDHWEDDIIMGRREDGTYASDTIALHNGDQLKVRKDRAWGEEYPIGYGNNYVVNIEKDASYFVVFNPETHEITLEYDTMANLSPEDIGNIITGG